MSTFKIQAPPLAQAREAKPADLKDDKKAKDAAKVGRDFEAILVRQMLSQTKVAGKGGGYADMAVESLATSITSAGGLGLGRAIQNAISAHAHPVAPALEAAPDKKK